MLKEFNIKGYRRFRDITFRNFSHINVIAGKNNCGKTTFLEAVFAWCCGVKLSPMLPISILRQREPSNLMTSPQWMLEAISCTFNEKNNIPFSMSFDGKDDIPSKSRTFTHTVIPYDYYPEGLTSDFLHKLQQTSNNFSSIQTKATANSPIEFPVICQWTCQDNLGDTKTYSIRPTPFFEQFKPHYEARYIDFITHAVSQLNSSILNKIKMNGQLDEFTKDIQSEFEFIKGFDIINYENIAGPVSVYIKDGNRQPLYSFGDGLQRFFNIVGTIMLCRDSILCIDEAEMSLHYSAQEQLCTCLIKYAKKYNVQIFLTTHSQEFLDNMLSAAYKIKAQNGDTQVSGLNDLSFYTFGEYQSLFRYRYLNGQEAYKARAELYLDLRGEK